MAGALFGMLAGLSGLNTLGNFGIAAYNNASSYHYSLNLQKQAQEWQERMANTAHQREIADLRAAGLNPILTATGGNGASSGSVGANGFSPSPVPNLNLVQDVTNFANTLVNSAQGIENISTQQAQQDLFKAQAVEALSRANLSDEQRNYVSKLFDVDLKNAMTNEKNAETNRINANTEKEKVGVAKERNDIERNNNLINNLSSFLSALAVAGIGGAVATNVAKMKSAPTGAIGNSAKSVSKWNTGLILRGLTGDIDF